MHFINKVAPAGERIREPMRNALVNTRAMPWDVERYPASMKNLLPAVREKAILIANALLADGYTEGQAIRIAIARAKAWAAHRCGSDVTQYDPALRRLH
jgi:hypothetical protein